MSSFYHSLRKEYLNNRLDECGIDPDPLKQFDTWMKEAIVFPVPEANAMVLCTSTLTGLCSSRVVLLKGIEHGAFLFFTNYESRKGREMLENPYAALLFFWKEMERQVRIEGRVEKTTGAVSAEYFNSRPFESRISALVSPQSQVVPDRKYLEELRERTIDALHGRDPSCPPYWGGFQLTPSSMEFWQGRENRLHDRIRYRKVSDQWATERLAP